MRIAIAFDCVRRGDLDAAAASLAQAARLFQDGTPSTKTRNEGHPEESAR